MGLARFTIVAVNARMTQTNRDTLQWPLLSPRVQREGHRGARAERRQEQIVWRGATVGSPSRRRFVAEEAVRAGGDFLGKTAGTAANDDDAFSWLVGVQVIFAFLFSEMKPVD